MCNVGNLVQLIMSQIFMEADIHKNHMCAHACSKKHTMFVQ